MPIVGAHEAAQPVIRFSPFSASHAANLVELVPEVWPAIQVAKAASQALEQASVMPRHPTFQAHSLWGLSCPPRLHP